MTQQESLASRTRRHAPMLPHRRRGPFATRGPDTGDLAPDEALVGRVAACALGLAYAEREDADGLRELVEIAEAREPVLAAARARISEVGVVDEPTRARADALLYTAIGHLDRLVG